VVPSLWHLLTRLGEMTLLMPAALLAALLLWHDDITRPLAQRWLTWLGVGALLTTATKLAFMGWGVGIAELDFTGVSGHAMFAAAIYPTLAVTLASRLSPLWQRVWLALGVLLAVAVGFSRIEVGAHSISEVIAGLAVGGERRGVVVQAPAPQRVRLAGTAAGGRLAGGIALACPAVACPFLGDQAVTLTGGQR
jgi:membrane-associated phospholipid phosphatase